MEDNRIICGSALEVLRDMPAESISCSISSPPYWALRDYGVDGQLGLEKTFEEYIDKLCDIYDQVKRVLRKDGTCFVNLGDTYGTSSGAGSRANYKQGTNKGSYYYEGTGRLGVKNFEKSLCLIPQRFAIEMVNRDTMDIYELDKGFIVCNNISVTENKTGVDYAIQRPRKSKAVQHGISEKVESGTQRPIQETNGRVEKKEQGQDESVQPEILRDTSGTRNNSGNEGECKATPKTETGSDDSLWWKSSEVRLLWGGQIPVYDDRPHQRQGESTQEGNKKYRLDLRVVKENELSKRFQSFVYELQLGKGEIRILPPSRGRNLCLRKRDIPPELIPLFKLKKQERWILRNVLIWHKPNPMPSSAKDRFTVDFEYVYFFVKSKKYWFEPQYEPVCETTLQRDKYTRILAQDGPQAVRHDHETPSKSLGRNKRCVWTIPTQSFPDAHFATFPEKLVEPMIKAGCPEFICTKCGKAREKIYKKGDLVPDEPQYKPRGRNKPEPGVKTAMTPAGSKQGHPNFHYETNFKGYTDCGCNADWRPGVVLDMFRGNGNGRSSSSKIAA